MLQINQGPLEPSLQTSDVEWRKLKIECCVEESSKEELDDILCNRLGEVVDLWNLDDLL